MPGPCKVTLAGEGGTLMTHFSSFKPLKSNKSDRFDKNIIEKLKEFVEINYCQEKKIVSQLMPY
jgi:hypothetical protein